MLVAFLRAGGVGLNLIAASVVFHFDHWWNPAVETQAEDRAHRIGQTRPVQVFAYLTPDSIKQHIGAILQEKRALFADIIDAWPRQACAASTCRPCCARGGLKRGRGGLIGLAYVAIRTFPPALNRPPTYAR